MILLWVLLAVVFVGVIVVISYFNRFAILVNRIENSSSQIDVQLKKRADLVPNLVESVKGYMKHEKSVIQSVNDARKSLVSAKDFAGKVKAGDVLSNALGKIFAIAENYPNLKANEGFIQLQNELSVIEDKIAYARQFFNDSILEYDNLRSTFPGNTFAAVFGRKELPYLTIPDAEKQPVKVKFD
ncbi:MAG: LemA family protein [archaeon]